jgi:hypothetical protein
MITSDGNRNPAKPDRRGATRPGWRRILPPCPIPSSVNATDPINTINTYITKWNHDSKPFTWTATANDIITRVRLIHRDFKKLLDNNDNSQ